MGSYERRAGLIVKLMPEQISQLWDSIRYGIIKSIAPLTDPTPDNMQDILCQLLKQDMQCWCVYDDEKNIYGYIVTSISVDINTNFRTLIIYSVFLYKKASVEMWGEGFEAIEKYAKANKCTRIAAYTSNEKILSIAGKAGYMKDYTYLVKDIGG